MPPPEHPAGHHIYARVRLAKATDAPLLHKLMQQMASYHGYAKVFTATEASVAANLWESNPRRPPFFSATALVLEVSHHLFPSVVSVNSVEKNLSNNEGHSSTVFDPVLRTVRLDSAIEDRDSGTYESRVGGGVVAGYVLFYPSYSGYFEKPGIFMENFFVRECYRGIGLGKMMFAAVAAKAAALGFSAVDWLVVGWNAEAIEFYVGMGGQIMHDVKRFRLSGERLSAYAAEEEQSP
ncbi:unnamed protein product [Cuscuta campestris]|uniref:N-acetyltransferase domain-containing protein n=1 Tax=Cuscuta campestris TaxID=132261 RepID=A0A484N8F2_9ASTE|nr:unnamed protein product [Cuscuta campestris]